MHTRWRKEPGWFRVAEAEESASPVIEVSEPQRKGTTAPYASRYALPAGEKEAKPYVPKVPRARNLYTPRGSGRGSPTTPHVVFDRIRIAVLFRPTLDGRRSGRNGKAN